MMVRIQKPQSRKTTIIIGLIIIAMAGLLFGLLRVNALNNDGTGMNPNFDPVLPEGKTIEQLDGWQKLTPPNGGTSYYAYNDTLAGVSIIVSQQVLPGKIKNNPDNEMADIARATNLTVKFNAGDTVAYLGKNAKGPQSVIFTKDGLLFNIKSWSEIQNADWIGYINALK